MARCPNARTIAIVAPPRLEETLPKSPGAQGPVLGRRRARCRGCDAAVRHSVLGQAAGSALAYAFSYDMFSGSKDDEDGDEADSK